MSSNVLNSVYILYLLIFIIPTLSIDLFQFVFHFSLVYFFMKHLYAAYTFAHIIAIQGTILSIFLTLSHFYMLYVCPLRTMHILVAGTNCEGNHKATSFFPTI